MVQANDVVRPMSRHSERTPLVLGATQLHGEKIYIIFVMQVIYRAIFNQVSKVIRDCIAVVIGLENLRHPLSQSDATLKPILTWSLTFSNASGRLHVLTLSSDWFLLTFIFVLIGRCDYLSFGFMTLNRKALYVDQLSV